MATKVIKGIDIPFNIAIKDANGSAINLDSLQGLIVLLYYGVSGQILAKYSLKALAGYQSLDVLDPATNGVIQLKIPASVTKDAQTGIVLLELKMKSEDAEWEDGNLETGLNGVEAFELIESRLKNVEY